MVTKSPETDIKHLVFVYGSLKKGFHNHVLLEDSKLIGNAVTEDKYRLVSLNAFPCVINDHPLYQIQGEVYEVDDETFKSLDMLEGHPYNYMRFRVPVIIGKRKTAINAWLYFICEAGYQGRGTCVEGIWHLNDNPVIMKKKKHDPSVQSEEQKV